MCGLCVLLLTLPPVSGAGAKTPLAAPARADLRLPCLFDSVALTFDFSEGDLGFHTATCEETNPPAWEHGPTSLIPGAPAQAWGTILDANYEDYSGMSLCSPYIYIAEATRLMQVLHYYDTEAVYDGGNVTTLVGGNEVILLPVGGYPVDLLNPDPLYYAYCVDGEPGWSGHDATWRVDCFDLSPFMGTEISLHFDFGSDASVNAPGWYIASIQFGSPAEHVAACCGLPDSPCELMTESACFAEGGEWLPDWISCEPNPCAVPLPDIELEFGPWIDAEPWHNWIAATPGTIQPVRVCTGDVPGQVQAIDFYYSSDGGATWQHFDTDDDGTEPDLRTYGPGVVASGDGWTGYLRMPEGLPNGPVTVRVIIHTDQGDFEAVRGAEADHDPPSLGTVSVQEWTVTDVDALGTDVDPGGCDLGRILVFLRGKDMEYQQGVPGINQHIVSDQHCAPTATAQSLKYWESTGDTQVTGGLPDLPLVNGLADIMHTSPDSGTTVSNWVCGTEAWISQHGHGYTVRERLHFTEDGSLTWSVDDWRLMRNELEREVSVLSAVFWQTGGGHTMTLDAIVNTLLPNGRILLGFKDPWTGGTSIANLDPATGLLHGVGGAGGGGVGYLGSTVLVAPREASIADGGPGAPIFDGLPPGPPYHLEIPLPGLGSWFVHFVLVDQGGHAYRISRIVTRLAPGANPEGDGAAALANRLLSCRPNPFRTETTVAFMTKEYGPLRIEVFDVQGRRIRTLAEGAFHPGAYEASWDGRDSAGEEVSAGVYYVGLRVGPCEERQAVTLVR